MSKENTAISTAQAKQKLHEAYRTKALKSKLTVIFQSLLILLAGFTVLVLVEEAVYLTAFSKSFLLILLLGVSFISLWMGMKNKSSESFESFYRGLSKNSNIPELKDVLDLEKSNQGNPALIHAAILQSLSRVSPSRLQEILEAQKQQSTVSKQFNSSLLITALLLTTAIVTAFYFSDASQRTLTFWESFQKPNPFLFDIAPGSTTVEQGSAFKVTVNFNGETPEEVALRYKTAVESNFRSQGMESNGKEYHSASFDANNSLEYFIQMDEFKSEIYSIDVQLRPRFSELTATVIPPSYTGLDTTELSYPFSRIRAFEGSHVQFNGRLNKPVELLAVNTPDTSHSLDPQPDSTFAHQMAITKEDTLTFSMADESDLTNSNPFRITVNPQQDEYPIVEILEPDASFEQVNPSQINILFRASDDFSLTGARLSYELRRAYVDQPISDVIKLPKPRNGAVQSHIWDLTSIKLKPQDVLTFWVEVQDNDGYRGYKSSRSQTLTLTVPSLVNYFEDLDSKEDEVGSDLDDVSESFNQMQDQYEQFKQKMKENPGNAGYDESRELEQVQKQHEEVQKQIEEMNRKFEEIKKELSENNTLSEDTREAYEELQKLMEEIDDPEFMEALQKMRENLEQFTPEQLRQAMEELEFNEELYKERLQRTIELFKQLKLNSDLDKLTKAFEDQARKEEDLNRENVGTEEKKNHRSKSIEETEKLKNKVDSLSENAGTKNKNAVEQYQDETAKELEKLMEQLKKELENGDTSSSPSEQNQKRGNESQSPQQSYEQLAKKTAELREQLSQQQQQVNIAGMKYVLNSLLTLSIEQENLTSLASATENRSQAYVGFARDQRNVEDIFSTVSDSLYRLSASIPQFSNDINKKKVEVEKRLTRSLEQMSERNQNQSSVASRQALGGINEISFMIANLLDQLQNSDGNGGGSGGMSMQQMMEQLQQSGEQQQRLNEELQNMINDLQGERLSQDQMERLNQIAKEQNRIRKQIEELQRNGKSGDKIGSELQRMIEEMEDTINDLRGGATDPTMVERQQNILSRMLEAEEALQKRDEEEKREGTTATEYDTARPPELTLEELEKQIRNRLNDPNFTKYSTDYQRLIEKYFELLKQLQNQEIQ